MWPLKVGSGKDGRTGDGAPSSSSAVEPAEIVGEERSNPSSANARGGVGGDVYSVWFLDETSADDPGSSATVSLLYLYIKILLACVLVTLPTRSIRDTI